ncbi:MAG: DUF4405 domain-containing protein [Bacteroidales bacterium]
MNNKFNWQSFISIGLLFSFIVMMFSGIVLYVAPEGSLSRWIDWNVLGLTKTQWEQQHTIFSYLFVGFTVFHIFKINWVLLWSYFFVEKRKFIYLKEILVALIISVIFFIGTLADISPFGYVTEFGSNISDSFGRDVQKPDISDPEKLSIEQFATQVYHVSYDDFYDMVEKHSLIIKDRDQTIQEFCLMNDISPEEFYKLINKEGFMPDTL